MHGFILIWFKYTLVLKLIMTPFSSI
jgi:hypothetical protein